MDQERLLTDGSVDFNVLSRAEAEQLAQEPPVTGLLHPEVRFESTDFCNAACVMCPRDLHDRAHGVMDRANYERLVDEVLLLGAQQVVITGFGEPLMDTDLAHKVRYAHERGLRTYIISNGSLLDERRSRELLEAGLDELRVSFYGMRPETYERVMVRLRFDVALRNLTRFLRIRREYPSTCRTRLQVSYLILPENEQDTLPFLRFWEPRADYVEVWSPHNYTTGRNYRPLTGEKRTCGRPMNGPLQIQWNGDVVACCFDFNNANVLGNVFESSVLDILNGLKYRMLRAAHRNRLFGLFKLCGSCDQLLEHSDALVYTNRHNLPNAEAVRLSNTDLFDLVESRYAVP